MEKVCLRLDSMETIVTLNQNAHDVDENSAILALQQEVCILFCWSLH